MKGDFSRVTFRKKKNYSSVLKQQGRVSLDADWNELCDIVAHHRRSRTKDIIGVTGAPILDGGFQVNHIKGQDDLLISSGRIYVNGLLCEFHPSARIPLEFPPNTKKKVRVEWLEISEKETKENPWVAIFSKERSEGEFFKIAVSESDSSGKTLTLDGSVSGVTSPYLRWMMLYSKQPHYPNVPPYSPQKGRTDLVFLDVWERHITAVEDPDIREIALGGPDTTTRVETVWQVRLFEDVGMSCLDFAEIIRKRLPPSGGLLTTSIEPSEEETNPCLLVQDEGYRGLQNRLYRVEIHKGGKIEDEATFKWSRDNGSTVYEIDEFISDASKCMKVRLRQLGRDQILRIKKGDSLEISGDETDLDVDASGTMVHVDDIDEVDQVLTLDVDIGKHSKETHPKVRRWDTGLSTPEGVTATSTKEIELEQGVNISFSGDGLKTGDYWVFAARASTGEIEELDSEPPMGIKHHYCPLALVKWEQTAGKWVADVHDCRPKFPSVTELTSLFYVSGDGQEAMPGNQLPGPLRVRAANGKWPVSKATVRFKIIHDNGSGSIVEGNKGINPILSVDKREMIIKTDSDGLAECLWNLDEKSKSQQMEATLLDDAKNPVHAPICFNANLSVASEVHYSPKDCPLLEDTKNVQEALDKLCRVARRGICAVTVGKGGQYETLVEAFKALSKDADICLCLLPGIHKINEDIEVNNKNSIRIAGCGARVNQECDEFSLGASRILLLDIDLHVDKESGMISLDGDEVCVERCGFRRTKGTSAARPLVLVKHGSTRAGYRCLNWRHNKMMSSWVESKKPKMKDLNALYKSVGLTKDMQTQFSNLITMSPRENLELINNSIKTLAQDILSMRKTKGATGIEQNPGVNNGALTNAIKSPVQELQAYLKESTITAELLQQKIEAIYYVLHFDVALALEYSVGGWIADNLIDGYVVLQYSDKRGYLRWNTPLTGEQRVNKEIFAKENEYLRVDPVTLTLRGNNLRALYSNGYSILQVIQSILDTGKWSHELPERGYRSLVVEENIFIENNSSFIGELLIMKGNQYAGATEESAIPAFVLGYEGVFVSNVVPYRMIGDSPSHKKISLEAILKPGWSVKTANLLQIA